jgi:hypothetical protein
MGVVRAQCPFLLKMALDNFTISIVISNLENLANVKTEFIIVYTVLFLSAMKKVIKLAQA